MTDFNVGHLTGATFKTAVATTVKTLGRGAGARVVFAGDEAKTNGDTVFIPALPDDCDMTSDDAKIIAGYADHEDLHIRHTSHEYDDQFTDEFSHNVWNALEDVRIERAGIEQYPGKKETLQAVSHASVEDLLGVEKESFYQHATDNPTEIVPVAITWKGRIDAGYAPDSMIEAYNNLPDPVRHRVDSYKGMIDSMETIDHSGPTPIEGRNGLRGTKDSFDISKRVMEDLMYNPIDQQPPPPEDGEGEGQGKGKGQGEGRGGRAGKQEGEGEGEGQGKQPAPDGGEEGEGSGSGEKQDKSNDTKPNTSEDRGAGGVGAGEVRLDPSTLTAVNADLSVKGTIEGIKGTQLPSKRDDIIKNWLPATKSFDQICKHDGIYFIESGERVGGDQGHASVFRYGSTERYQEMLEEIRPTTSVLKRRISREVMSHKAILNEGGLTRGRALDRRRLVQARRGRPDVYSNKVDYDYVDTAVSLLVDMSGSMRGGGKMDVATAACIALAEALEDSGIPLEILGFNTNSFLDDDDYDDYHHVNIDHDHCDRYGLMTIYEFKSFHDKLNSTRVTTALSSMPNMAGSGNNDPEAILLAHKRLMKQDNARRILMVLSDGSPAFHGTGRVWSESEYTLAAVQHVEKTADTLAIGIMDRSVTQYYSNSVVIDNVEALPQLILKRLQAMMFKK